MTFTIVSLSAAYALVVALLAYLLLLSRLHWVFKVLGTAATVALIPLTFNAVGELRGLPTDGPIPYSFRMLWAQVTEPNPLQSEKGNVFLWLQTLDKDNFPMGQPRAYQLPYSDDLKIKVNEAMGKIAQGEKVQGKIDANRGKARVAADLSTDGLDKIEAEERLEKSQADDALKDLEVELGMRAPETTPVAAQAKDLGPAEVAAHRDVDKQTEKA